MCRLFAQISLEPAPAVELLARSSFSLLKQSDHNPDRLQKDGWGIGHFEGATPVVTKSPRPAFKEAGLFEKAAGKAVSKTIIGHIRAATNPRGVASERLLAPENAQPFENGEWIFAHNGTIEIPEEISNALGDFKSRLRSLNDSEVYFWQFIKFLGKTQDPARAFELCVQELWDVWTHVRDRYPRKKAPYTSLNAVATDGKSLHAFCHALVIPEPNRSLYSETQPWYTLQFSERPGTLIVASESLDGGRWDAALPPEILSAKIAENKIELSRHRYDFKNGQLVKSASQETVSS